MRGANLDIALGRRPVKIGADGKEVYVYRGDVANTVIKMAGGECGMFKDKAEVTHRLDFDDLSDEQLLLRLKADGGALPDRFETEAKATLPIISQAGFHLDDLFQALKLQQIRLKHDQQVPIWEPSAIRLQQ